MGATDNTATIHPMAALLRGFAVDFLTAHNIAAVERIMTPDYRLHIGGHILSGRDSEYLPATAAQLQQFPGLCVTVHDVVLGREGIAMQFTEHGVSARHGGRAATWRGVTLFRTDGERLQTGWAEEDYFSRKVQLATGVCDRVDPPHPTPWDGTVRDPEPAVEQAAREWLVQPARLEAMADAHWVAAIAPHPGQLVDIADTRIDVLFSAGERVAFHLEHQGRYRGGFDDIRDDLLGAPVTLRAAGLLRVVDGVVTDARVTSDRLGLHRHLLDRQR